MPKSNQPGFGCALFEWTRNWVFWSCQPMSLGSAGLSPPTGTRQERNCNTVGCICNGVRCIQIWAGNSWFGEFACNEQKWSPILNQHVGLSSQLSAEWSLMMLLLLLRLEMTQTASENHQKSTGDVWCWAQPKKELLCCSLLMMMLLSDSRVRARTAFLSPAISGPSISQQFTLMMQLQCVQSFLWALVDN